MTILWIINSFPNCLMQWRQVLFVMDFVPKVNPPLPPKKNYMFRLPWFTAIRPFCMFSSVTFFSFALHFPFLSVLFSSFSFTSCLVFLYLFYNFPPKAPPCKGKIFGIVCVLIWSLLYNQGSKSSAFESLQFETDLSAVHCNSLDVWVGCSWLLANFV